MREETCPTGTLTAPLIWPEENSPGSRTSRSRHPGCARICRLRSSMEMSSHTATSSSGASTAAGAVAGAAAGAAAVGGCSMMPEPLQALHFFDLNPIVTKPFPLHCGQGVVFCFTTSGLLAPGSVTTFSKSPNPASTETATSDTPAARTMYFTFLNIFRLSFIGKHLASRSRHNTRCAEPADNHFLALRR